MKRINIECSKGSKDADLMETTNRNWEDMTTEITATFKKAVQDEINEAIEQGLPLAKYDAVNKRAYIEYSNGIREYIDG